jgi:hypothetical protein
MPLGGNSAARPLNGCLVSVTDDLGSTVFFTETASGTYVPPSFFHGVIGRSYTLHITANSSPKNLIYESFPMVMRPVPPIDSVYYEKRTIVESNGSDPGQEGCQIYINTHDPANLCKFYRWEYSETWEFRLPYRVTNNFCWVSDNSGVINIKNASILVENRIDRFPLDFISNATDRLNVKYSMLVNQYSLSEDEYLYWEKLQNISEQVGGLYDIIPSAIPSNVYCPDDPNAKVLGYFSVSAVSSKRIFIKDHFAGAIDLYFNCASDTIYGRGEIPHLNTSVWVIVDQLDSPFNPLRVITDKKGCADCTVRGTIIRPDFWQGDK